jgi:acetate kinase
VRILTVNAGSTSTKVALVTDGTATLTTLDDALAAPAPDAVAHRVVHGGDRDRAIVLDDARVEELRGLTELAPLHQPPALALIDRCRAAWPGVPEVACFDTAFHATIPPAARTYALPAALRARVRAYGFHGLSFAWSARRVGELAPASGRVVIAHLGGGQSLCAVRDGRSVMTTMGFTPIDGLVMATRSGAVDPGAVAWMVEHGHTDLADVLERESGLLGLCGTDDMREVHARAAGGDRDARLAFAVWCHRAVVLLGGCVAALGGIDALVFTGGIGERDRVVRRALTDAFAWVGVGITDAEDGPDDSSAEGDRELTAPGATVRTFVIGAREDLHMAGEAAALLAGR